MYLHPLPEYSEDTSVFYFFLSFYPLFTKDFTVYESSLRRLSEKLSGTGTKENTIVVETTDLRNDYGVNNALMVF